MAVDRKRNVNQISKLTSQEEQAIFVDVTVRNFFLNYSLIDFQQMIITFLGVYFCYKDLLLHLVLSS